MNSSMTRRGGLIFETCLEDADGKTAGVVAAVHGKTFFKINITNRRFENCIIEMLEVSTSSSQVNIEFQRNVEAGGRIWREIRPFVLAPAPPLGKETSRTIRNSVRKINSLQKTETIYTQVNFSALFPGEVHLTNTVSLYRD